jgi:hypothetical protein
MELEFELQREACRSELEDITLPLFEYPYSQFIYPTIFTTRYPLSSPIDAAITHVSQSRMDRRIVDSSLEAKEQTRKTPKEIVQNVANSNIPSAYAMARDLDSANINNRTQA